MNTTNTKKIGHMFKTLSPNGLTPNDIPELKDFQLTLSSKGSCAEFYHAKEVKSSCVCGIKKISKSENFKKGWDRWKLKDNVKREIQIHSTLDNKYVISLYGYFEDNDNYYLILEDADDDLYYHRLTSAGKFLTLEEKTTLKYIKMVAIGLQYIHNNGIVHKDIKIENLVIRDGDIKIIDFGLSEYINAQVDTFFGTTEYKAPEIGDKAYATKETDIYALGVTTYVLLHGAYPKFPLKFGSYVSKDCEELISRMTNTFGRITLEEFFEVEIIKKIEL